MHSWMRLLISLTRYKQNDDRKSTKHELDNQLCTTQLVVDGGVAQNDFILQQIADLTG